MNCGNDPNARMTPGDRAVVDWFKAYLRWAWVRDNEGADAAGPEPVCPDGRQVNADLARLDEETP